VAVAFTRDEIVAVTDWLRNQSMRDDLDVDLREGINNARDAIQAMLYDVAICHKGLLDIRTWVDSLLADKPTPTD